MRLEQLVAIEVKVAHQGCGDAGAIEPLSDMRHRSGGFIIVDRDTHQFGPGTRQCAHLRDRGFDIRGVGVGHGLNDDGRCAANGD